MATLVHYPADLTEPRLHSLDRRVVRLGSDPDNEALLEGRGVSPHHAHLVYEKGNFTIAVTDRSSYFFINGKKKKSAKLHDGDLLRIGENVLKFVLDDSVLVKPATSASAGNHEHFSALHRFSVSLMATGTISELLNSLLDQLIELTGADKAFLILMDDGHPRVRVARNIDDSTFADPDAAVSDSIVQEVLESREALIIADALSHEEFRSSESVVNLKLCSVMCVPLVARGSTLGLFYLGNDNIVNNFTDQLLSVVTVFAAQAALILANALSRAELERDFQELETRVGASRFGEIIGASDNMREVFKKIGRVASTDISVLIEGETGTGKELVARAIHQRSNRDTKPFVVINCGAIPENLLESELFGHVKGSFTGAVSTTTGRFQAADGGTLFLDEIGEMPVSLQVKLLRVLQERKITRVGDTKELAVDIRILAATNKNLAEEIKTGGFREDLFYRLNVINLRLPPLRDRGDDIVLVAKYLLGRFSQELIGQAVSLSNEAIRALRSWQWPGNIRELENRIKKAVVFSDNGVITPEHLDLGEDKLEGMLPLADAREAWQRDYINQALAMYDGNRTQTARVLDVDPRTIFRHLERERGES
jgi:transcriptional regulator with GAF, ATPase, and Fis domain